MPNKKTFLDDPDTELTDEEWEKITQAAGDKVRAESERMARKRQGDAKPTDQTDTSD